MDWWCSSQSINTGLILLSGGRSLRCSICSSYLGPPQPVSLAAEAACTSIISDQWRDSTCRERGVVGGGLVLHAHVIHGAERLEILFGLQRLIGWEATCSGVESCCHQRYWQ
jgi:LSD1 subclass zinc finger protein